MNGNGRNPVTGRAVGERIGHGVVRIVHSVEDLHRFKDVDGLVSDKTDPEWGPLVQIRSPLLRSESHRDYQSTDAVGNFARGKIRVTRGIAFDKLFVTAE